MFFYKVNIRLTRDHLSPLTFLSALFFVGFILRPITVLVFGDYYRTDWTFSTYDQVQQSAALALLYAQHSFIALCSGYIFLLRGVPYQRRQIRVECSIQFAHALTLIGILFFISYLMVQGFSLSRLFSELYEVDKRGMYLFQYGSMLIIPSNLLYFIFLSRNARGGIFATGVYLIHLFVTLAISLSFYDRKWFILTLIGLLLAQHYKKTDGIRPFKLVTLMFGLSIMLVALLMLRNYFVSGVAETRSITGLYFDHFIIGGVFSFFDYFCYQLFSMPEINWNHIIHWLSYLGGSVIPSSAFEAIGIDKPLPFNILIGRTLLNAAPAPAFGLVGEGYFIGGWGGVMLISILTGLLLSNRYVRFLQNGRLIHYAIFMMFFSLCIRTGFSTALTGWILFGGMFYVLRMLWIALLNNFRFDASATRSF